MLFRSEKLLEEKKITEDANKVYEKTEDKDEDQKDGTSLILRNLPPHFDQQASMRWVDEKGYRGGYDFLLWFPAKKTARHNTSSVFMNLRTLDLAKRFQSDFYLFRFPAADGQKSTPPLNISTAKVQGFTENFIRFWHLTKDESNTTSICKPYFATDMVSKISAEDKEGAESNGRPGCTDGDGQPVLSATTVIIRNLPPHIESQQQAMDWLLSTSHGRNYNFFLFVPHKRNCPKSSSSHTLGLAYIFVNYDDSRYAKACAADLDGTCLHPSEPALSVVPSRVQGQKACMAHFQDLAESGRLVPWTKAQVNRPGSEGGADNNFEAASQDAPSGTALKERLWQFQ